MRSNLASDDLIIRIEPSTGFMQFWRPTTFDSGESRLALLFEGSADEVGHNGDLERGIGITALSYFSSRLSNNQSFNLESYRAAARAIDDSEGP